MVKNKVDIITLGCSKNLVDSEQLLRQLQASGYSVEHDSENVDGEIVVINTCGFIGDAKEESIDMILQFCEAKRAKKIKKLYVMGCLSGRYINELPAEIPEVDKFYGKFDWKGLLHDLGTDYDESLHNERVLTTPSHYAYVKIGEGCNRTCAYCAIPIITGKYKSRTIEDIEDEVRKLVAKGVKEFQIIAQDLTFYGWDIYREFKLPELVERISDIPGVEWIRLHYAYPAQFPMDLLRVMRERDNVCKYLDIALQHISDNVLTRMRRHVTKQQTYDLMNKIREEVPGIHLRTTLLVGFPGETDEDFEELKQFVKDMRFDRLGAFPYSPEEDTYSYKHYEDDVEDDVKQDRMSEIMAIQERIAGEMSQAKVGQTMRVIIDREEGEWFIGRTEFDTPEVDPEVLIRKVDGLELSKGSFYMVKITDAQVFDLYAEVVND
ncbi:MAG: 30S ribosomal protein S12 methylthiotransferase RimO [Bacteroidales bacterium]